MGGHDKLLGGSHQFTGEFTELHDGLKIKLTTPFNVVKTVHAKYSLKKNVYDYEGTIEAGINQHKIHSTLNGKATYSDKNKVSGYTINTEMSLPIANFEATGLEFSYTAENGVAGHINMYSGPHKINSNFHLKKSRHNNIDITLKGTNSIFTNPSFSVALSTKENSLKVSYSLG